MKILHVSPIFSSQHYCCGWFFLRAFAQLGHHVSIWDNRMEQFPPTSDYNLAFVYKGDKDTLTLLPHRPKICYYPDDVARDSGIERILREYDRVFTTLRPTPSFMTWFPTGFDPDLHRLLNKTRTPRYWTAFIGTFTERKAKFLRVMQPQLLCGNGWPNPGEYSQEWPQQAKYLHEYVEVLNSTDIAINLHQNGNIGVNSRLFEMMACTFTITDTVPGVEEVLGKELAARVGFKTPEEGGERIEHFLSHPKEREELWHEERKAIAPYTYLECAKKVIECVS